MTRRFRPPMFLVAAALLGLIVLLATLQYRWLGQISTAERERMRANLASRTAAFAQDFDREITRAFLTFQLEPIHDGENLATRLGQRYDRWVADSRHPRMIGNVYVVSRATDGSSGLRRYNPTTRFVEPADWPAELHVVRDQMVKPEPTAPGATFFVRNLQTLWDSVPAIVVPAPVMFVNTVEAVSRYSQRSDAMLVPSMRYAVLVLDREYVKAEMLPALARQHFSAGDERHEYQVAVVSHGDKETVFSTAPSFTTEMAARADAAADLFQIRVQEFGAMASEVRRFTSLITQTRGTAGAPAQTIIKEASPPISIVLREGGPAMAANHRALETGLAAASAARPAQNQARWRLVVKHPSGSLETAVAQARRRNLLVSSGILGLLGISVGFLVVTTRRAQDLARQQMEFVSAVSHELRTPLAVIRSAADNLAEGIVHQDAQVRRYGELVRGEGRRLTDMVEQILELSGIQSGQRGFALRPVGLLSLVHDVLRVSAPLIDDAGLRVEIGIPETLPPVLGEEQALRRVIQNLVGNAIKYGGQGGSIGITANATAREVAFTVADRGTGIPAADQPHIFEPFYRAPGVIEAQIQGAGLGLSLVQRIVEAHGGRVSVRSSPGEGSEFTVHLPAASQEPSARHSSASDAAPNLHRGASA